jgi:hypothetical protein
MKFGSMEPKVFQKPDDQGAVPEQPIEGLPEDLQPLGRYLQSRIQESVESIGHIRARQREQETGDDHQIADHLYLEEYLERKGIPAAGLSELGRTIDEAGEDAEIELIRTIGVVLADLRRGTYESAINFLETQDALAESEKMRERMMALDKKKTNPSEYREQRQAEARIVREQLALLRSKLKT